jgi:hypothetical protein
MEILGREAYSIDYSPIIKNTIRVNIKHREGDCRKIFDHYYECTENCDGFFMMVDFLFPDESFSGKPLTTVNALTKKRDYVNPIISLAHGIENCEQLGKLYEELMRVDNVYNLEIIRKPGDIIYMADGIIAGRKFECGLVNEKHIYKPQEYVFGGEVIETLDFVEEKLPFFIGNAREMTLREKIREIYESIYEHPSGLEKIRGMFQHDHGLLSALDEYLEERRK